MDITLVVNKLDLRGGGSNHSLELLARRLARTGNDVSVVTLNPKKNALTGDHPFTVVEAEPGRLGTRLGTHEQVYRVLERYERETDVYHVFAPNLLPGAGLYCTRDPATPVVGRLNNYNMFCVNTNRMDGECYRNCSVRAKFAHQDAGVGKRLAKLPLYASRTYVEPRLAGSANRYFAVSPAVKRIYAEIGIPEESITVVPNFYDPQFPAPETPPATSDSGFEVVYVGRMKRLKGVDILLRAIARTTDVSATLVGDGPAMERLTSLADDLDISSRVTFTGRVPQENLPDYYAGADVFVHPARLPEPFNRTLLESFQCGTPAVVSDIGGPPWVVGDAGKTFRSEDDASLATVLQTLRDDPSLVERLGESCSARLAKFSPDRVMSSIAAEYERLLPA